MKVNRTLGAVCGIIGPTAFVSAWVVGGLRTDGYDPLEEAISQLAREGAETRPLMTGGFIAFGVLIPIWARVLRRELDSRAVGAAATVAGVSTLAVAALPLTRDPGGTQDLLHAIAAGIGYVGMALTPLLASGPLRRLGRDRAAAASVVVGVISIAGLSGTLVFPERSGGMQRLGLTIVDAWHVVAGVWVLRRARSGD